MKKIISVTLFVAILFTTIIPAFAQKSLSERRDIARTRTEFGNVEAFTEGTGVVVRWEMKTEVQNVGFNVYRTGFGRSDLVNETLILGALGRSASHPVYGSNYQIYDPNGDVNSNYVIESRAINGRSLLSKQIEARPVKKLEEVTGISSESFVEAALSKNRSVEDSRSTLTTELAQIVDSAQQTPNLETHRWVVSQPGAKIAVKKDGLYRVSAAQLFGAGIAAGSDPTKWRLFLDGNEQAIIVGSGGDYIEFYGKGIDRPESDTRNYYLITDTIAGKRIGTRVLRPSAGFATAMNYPVVGQKKERFLYVNDIKNGDEENFWGRIVSPPPAPPEAIPFNLTGIDFGSLNAEITVRMQGFSLNGSHRVRVGINGQQITEMTSSGYYNYSSTMTIPTSYLVEGANALNLMSLNVSDYNLFDTVTVKYARKYQADQDKIAFFTPGYKKVNLTGFSSSNIRVFDTTFDGTPTMLSNLSIVQDGDTYTVKLPSSRTMMAYGVEESAILQSPSVIANNPSTLSAASNAADLVIISHSSADFMAAGETWANYRRDQGFTVKVIDVADIFDEFGYGVFSSDALKLFLKEAYSTWQTPPRYVLLLGDGSYDPRNYEGFGYFDLIPTETVSLIYEESGSDEALADFDNDGLAEMAIGRIPVRTAADIATIFNKTTTFETPAMQSLIRGALFVHDTPDGFPFSEMSRIMSEELPRNMPVAFVDRGTPTAQADLINQMNTGKFVINYSGHGSTGVWRTSSFFGIGSVPQLTNRNSPSIYNMLTCLNGYFLLTSYDSLSETLLKAPNGGAVTAWSSTSETTPDVQLDMGRRFFEQLAAGDITRMGDLVKDAKTVLSSGADVRLSWVLLGDPMLKVR